MRWEKPKLEIIEMNAEIGGYQSDFDIPPVLRADTVEPEIFVEPATPAAAVVDSDSE